MKIITISMQDWFFNAYLSEVDNISDRVRYLVQLGAEAEMNQPEEKKRLSLRQAQEIQNLRAELYRKNMTIASLKAKKKGKYLDETGKKIEGLKRSGVLRDLV
jgi:flagellar motor switch/type III secretory pathway protein FliN